VTDAPAHSTPQKECSRDALHALQSAYVSSLGTTFIEQLRLIEDGVWQARSVDDTRAAMR